jgi:hypothetical protein
MKQLLDQLLYAQQLDRGSIKQLALKTVNQLMEEESTTTEDLKRFKTLLAKIKML